MEVAANAVSGQATDNASKDPLNDAINAAFTASEGKTAEADTKGTAEPKVEVKPTEDTDAGDKRDGEKAAESKPDAEAQEPKAAEDGKAKEHEAPHHWSAEDKAAFSKLPAEGREVTLRLAKNLQSGFTRKSQELSDQAKFATTVRQLFDEPTRAQMQRAGVDEVGTFRYLLDLQRNATSDPVRYVKWFMQQSGMTPDHLGFPTTAKPDLAKDGKSVQDSELRDLLSDPEVKRLEVELNETKAKLARFEDWRLQRETSEQQAQQQQHAQSVQTIQSEIGKFRSAQDEHGQLQYPHFDTVSAHMGALMEHDPDLAQMPDGPDKLAKAYDMAVHARPDLRQTFVEQEVTKRLAEARKKDEAERAKRITAVKPASGAAAGKPKPKSLDDALNSAFEQHGVAS